LGSLVPGSRKQKQLSDDEVERIASAYRSYRRERPPVGVAGFCGVASEDDVRGHGYALTPGRYVGAEDDLTEDEPFEEKFKRLTGQLEQQFVKSAALEREIRSRLAEVRREG
jgi:type I restriction enzyme M protein